MQVIHARQLWLSKLRQRHLPLPLRLGVAAVAIAALCLLVAQPPRVVVPTLAGYPRSHFRQHWVRVVFPWQDAAEARRKAALPRFRFPEGTPFPPFPIRVISLTNATQRRQLVKRQLDERGIRFEFSDAVDGTAALPEDEVLWYSAGSKRKHIFGSEPGSFWRRHIADDLSHYRLMHRMLAEGEEMQLVFEDDFQLVDEGGDFMQRLKQRMEHLPEDWEMFWLNHGRPIRLDPANLLGFVGHGVRLFAENSGTMAYIYRRSFALKALNDAQIGTKDIDDLINDQSALGRAAGYVADPPLVRPHKLHNVSTIDVPPAEGGG